MSAVRFPFGLSVAQSLAWMAVILGGAVLVVQPLPGSENAALALTIACLGLWATGAVPEPVTAVIFFTAAMLLKAAPSGVVFGGFESAALWLIFGGLVMGVAVRDSGLADRIARRLSHAFGSSYGGLIAGVTLIGTTLGFLLPSSMGRVMILMPIALGLAARAGFRPGSNGHLGVVLAAAFGCHVSTFSILPANVPNLVLVGAAETLGYPIPTYGAYLLLHFPVLGLLKTLVMVLLIVRFWPDVPRPEAVVPQAPAPLTRSEGLLAVLLGLALVLWATDFLHHISPAWISMVVAVVLLLPRIGLVDRATLNNKISYGSLLYVAGIMGLGAMVDSSGLGRRLAEAILPLLPLAPDHPVGNFISLTALATVVSLVTTLPGAPAVLTPLTTQLAEASGLPVETVLMSQVLGFSNPILPYQSAPLVVALHLGGERLAPARDLCLLLALVTFLVLFPLDFLWWRLLGWL